MKQAKNAVERHVIWSDIHLDLDDWRDFLMENYPELPEDKLYEKMHELNAEYLDDERRNLNIQFSQPILVIGDIGRWNGRVQGYKMVNSGNIRDCLYSDTDMTEWYVDKMATCGQMPFTTTAQITICTVCSSAKLPMRKLRICKTRSIAGERHARILQGLRSGSVTVLPPSMVFGFRSSGHGSVTRGKTGHAEMRLTVRRNLKTKGMRFSLQYIIFLIYYG